MELVKLAGVLIVIVGFALKLDSILIIFLALITTGIVQHHKLKNLCCTFKSFYKMSFYS